MNLTFESLRYKHKDIVQGFMCNDEPTVADFLKEKALNLHEQHSARTRLYFDEDQNLIGYFTLFNDHIRLFRNKIQKHNWELPDMDWFPSVKLHYIGVDSRFRKRDYGSYLLAEAVGLSLELSDTSGCNFLVLEALESSVDFYLKYGFFSYGSRTVNVGEKITRLTDMILKLHDVSSEQY